MIETKLEQAFREGLKVTPTSGQESAIHNISEFLLFQNQDSVFLLKGYAGTGKTLLVSALVEALAQFRIQVELLAPTGRAAKVLSMYCKKPAFTIHKKIFRQQSSSDGMGKFVLDFNKQSNVLFIVDEASMISNELTDGWVFGSGRLLDDLLEYVYQGRNCRLMLVGDTAQLPPVGLEISPALDSSVLIYHGFKVFVSELSEVVRQAQQSGILFNATKIRSLIKMQHNQNFFSISLEGMTDVERISGEFLIEKIGECYDRYGDEETIVVTRSNKRANQFNQGIRKTILWREDEVNVGDLLMVVRNNYFYVNPDENLDFIANGDIGRVVRIRKYENLYGFRYANITLQLIDYNNLEIECKIFLDTLLLEKPSFGTEENQQLFQAVSEDYAEIQNKKKKWEKIRENPYFNALQVKYAYSVTCHKAQGGQWEVVFIDHGYLTEEMISIDFLRWMYTAFTRPKTKLFLVNFDKNFFNENERI
jgi:exodeoxyribonuclease V